MYDWLSSELGKKANYEPYPFYFGYPFEQSKDKVPQQRSVISQQVWNVTHLDAPKHLELFS